MQHGVATHRRRARAIAALIIDVVEEHLRTHVVTGTVAKRSAAADEFMDAVRTYLK